MGILIQTIIYSTIMFLVPISLTSQSGNFAQQETKRKKKTYKKIEVGWPERGVQSETNVLNTVVIR